MTAGERTNLLMRMQNVEPIPDHALLAPASYLSLSQTAGVPAYPPQSTVLIVAPLPASRNEVKNTLHGLGHELVETDRTSDAIEILSRRKIDLVLVDLWAPEIGGVNFCRILKSNATTQLIPIFLLADWKHAESEVLAINSGADDFLVRPLRAKAARARVQASLRHKSMIDSLDDSEAVLFSLAQSVEQRDPAVGQHCQRIALLASSIGIALGLPADDLVTLQRGGYLHDIGKVAIPDHILFKPGPLSPDEWKIMQEHTVRGEAICTRMKSLEKVLPLIRHHHERWDGSGYPDNLRGEAIPLLARILQIADIFDALTTERPYKRAYSPDEALRIIQQEADQGWRDPALMSAFNDIFPSVPRPAPPDLGTPALKALADSFEHQPKHPARLAQSIAFVPRIHLATGS